PNTELPRKFSVTSPPRSQQLEVDPNLRLISSDMVSRTDALKHDPDRLAEQVMQVLAMRRERSVVAE
ncbi:MAG: hypothetical protein ACRDGF_03755, partial [Chloroflexota bacterium]